MLQFGFDNARMIAFCYHCVDVVHAMDLKAWYEGAARFLDTMDQDLVRLGLDLSAYPLDHLCYRVKTESAYQKMKSFASLHAILLSEALIAGRPIATFKLAHPIAWHGRTVSVVEIPSPKAGRDYEEGWEHAEF